MTNGKKGFKAEVRLMVGSDGMREMDINRSGSWTLRRLIKITFQRR
jgi:hypothetical protein